MTVLVKELLRNPGKTYVIDRTETHYNPAGEVLGSTETSELHYVQDEPADCGCVCDPCKCAGTPNVGIPATGEIDEKTKRANNLAFYDALLQEALGIKTPGSPGLKVFFSK